MIITIWVPFTVLTFEVNREFKQPTFLSDVVQPEVSLFLFNICLGSTKFLLLSVFPFKETIYPKICSKSRLRCAKSSLPVDARCSKTSLPVLLKIMTENGTNSPPMKVISNTILFVYSLRGALSKLRPDVTRDRLQNSPYFCVFKYARAVKQKVEAENKERDWACEARAVRARKILTPRFTDFFTDFGEKTDCFAVYTRNDTNISMEPPHYCEITQRVSSCVLLPRL